MSSNSFILNIGERNLKVVDMDKVADNYVINSMGLVDSEVNIYNSDEKTGNKVVPKIVKLLEDTKIEKKEVNIVIPNTYSYCRIIEMPILTEKELISAIKYQADQFIPVPIDKVNLDIEILRQEKNDKYLILLVAAQNSVLEKVTNIVEAAGLIPNSIENETSSIFSFISDIDFAKIYPNQNNNFLILINFGYATSSVYLFDKQSNIPLEIYDISIGLNIFVKDLMANYSISEDQAKNILLGFDFTNNTSNPQFANLIQILNTPYSEMFTEIEKFISSIKNKYNVPIDKLILFGDGLRINKLSEKITQTLGISSHIFIPDAVFQKNNVFDFFKNDLSMFIPSLGANTR